MEPIIGTGFSVMDEVETLEAKLECLSLKDSSGLVTGTGPSLGSNPAVLQNDIRNSLKTIGVALQKRQDGGCLELSKLHELLKKPLQQNEAVQDNDVGSVLSYLKLLSEFSIPTMSPEEGEKPKDAFWIHVLEPIASDILAYLSSHVFQRSFTNLSVPVQKNSDGDGESAEKEISSTHGSGYAFHQQLGILLKGVRILLVYLKRAIVSLRNEGGNNTRLKVTVTELSTLLASLMDPPKSMNNRADFDIGLDIRCNIGVGICYSIYYLSYPNEDHIRTFFNDMFVTTVKRSSLWSDFEQIILHLATTDMNRIALAFGVLNTWLDQNFEEELYYRIAENILNIEHGVKENVNLGSSRVMEIWTDKLARPCVPINVLKHVSTLFPSLEIFCFMYMTVHIDAVKNCCRNILSNLARIYDRLDDDKFPSLTGNTWVSTILSSILEKQAHVKWIALACIVKNTKKSLVLLETVPTIPEELLTTDRFYKTAANDTYVSLMSYHLGIVSSEAEWEKTWIDPLFKAQLSPNHETNWAQKKDIISIILNSDKFKLLQFKVMILPLLKSVVRRMNSNQSKSTSNTNQSENEDSEESLNFAETSLLAAETIKIAYELKIAVDPKELDLNTVRDSSSAPEDSFRGLVPRSVLNNWLWNENPQIRIAGCALLIETKKTSDIISRQDFDSLKIFLKYNSLSQDPAFRQMFMSYFKKLVRRLRDGDSYARRKKDTETVKHYTDFIRWLWDFLTEEEGLFVGANFARRCQALECLFELTELFPNGFEMFGLTKAGNTKYLRWLTDSYENNKTQALEIICRMPIEEFEDESFCDSLFNEAIRLCKSIKPPDSVTGRYLMTLLLRKGSTKEKYSPIRVLEFLYSELESLYQKIHSTSLIQVSSESPLYGCVRCIRMILGNTSEYKLERYSLQYRGYVAKLLKLCFEIDNVLFPVLGSAAPEGFLPGLKDSAPEENKQVVRSLSAQMLLVCAWRTMKEIALLMSDMCCWFVMEGELSLPSLKKSVVTVNPTSHLITFDQVSAIGNHLLYLLKNLMHRGVFEQVFVGFKQLATRLWKSAAPKLSNLPEKWLQDAMDQEHISSKSITRRSAGLPFIFQALLSAECNNETFLQKWVQRLLIFDETPEMSPVRIHSMNVLRGLFRDASFSSAMMPFVPHVLKIAFRGLKSLDWTERNSGLMLYGAVMRRTFGPTLNLMNAPTFFRKFPQMYDFLLNELDICIKAMEMRKKEQEILQSKEKDAHSSDVMSPTCDFTFHLLLLLSSFTSSVRVEDTHFKLAEFIPRIRKCGESEDMEVRKLSAKALVPFLTSPEDKQELAEVILSDLCQDRELSQNIFHGLLVQFLTIIGHLPKKKSNDAVGKLVCRFLSVIPSKKKMFSKASPTIFESLMEIMVGISALKSEIENDLYMSGLQILENSFSERFKEVSTKRNTVPGLPIADKIVANCTIKILASESTTEGILERVYDYFADSSSMRSKPYIDQLLELFLEDERVYSKLAQCIFPKNETRVETLVIVEAVISNYLRRVSSEFVKFPGTDAELQYLKFMEKIPAQTFESLDTEILSQLIQRLFQISDTENGISTTLQTQAAAFLVLGRIVLSTDIDISLEDKTRLCDIVLQWSTSDVDDDLRFAVTKSFPRIPFGNMNKFSVINQAKLWSSILLLTQDDESQLRFLISRKLSDASGSTCCDRKSLEALMRMYIREFLIPNPVEGLLVLIGLLIREDFEVEAKAADDETEDRLFDKSEMNMYFEHQTLTKTIKTEMEASKILDNRHLRFPLNKVLSKSQVEFLHVLANKTVQQAPDVDVTIRSILDISLSDGNQDTTVKGMSKLDALNNTTTAVVKGQVYEFLFDLLKSLG